ncbi:MAG: hypothetical protein R6X12_00725 [bacterium]
MNRTACALFVLALSFAFVAGCGTAEDKPAAVAAAPDAAAVDISALPEFLRYPGAEAVERIEVSTDDSRGTVWTLASAATRAEVEEWYQASVEKAGWLKDPEGGKVGVFEWVNPERTETIKLLAYEQDGKTSISITHGLK